MNNITLIINDKEIKVDNIIFKNTLYFSDKLDYSKIRTDYVMFYNEGNDYNNIDFNTIASYMSNSGVSLYALMPCYSIDDKIKNELSLKSSKNVDIASDKINLNLDCYVIKKELVKEINNNNYENILIKLLEKSSTYYQSVENKLLRNNNVISNVVSFTNATNAIWYTSDMEKHLLNNINKSVVNNRVIFCLWLLRLSFNTFPINSVNLSSKEYESFINLSRNMLKKLDKSIINSKTLLSMNINEKMIYYIYEIMYNKSNLSEDIDLSNEAINALSNKVNEISVNTINYKNGVLYFDCAIDSIFYSLHGLKVIANESSIEYTHINIYNNYKVFNKKYYSDYNIKFDIKVGGINNICFTTNKGETLNIIFPQIFSRLNNKYKNSYWNVDKKCIKYNNKKIIINNRNFLKTMVNELKYLINILMKDKSKKAIYVVCLRLFYFLSYPILNKRNIWITFDRIYKTGDCGEYLYRYSLNNANKNIYYVISTKAAQYNKIKEETKNVLIHGSLKCKLYTLHAKNLFITDSISVYNCGFNQYLAHTCNNLFNFKNNCIQHGLTMQDIPHRQNRLFDNIQRYFVASKYEVENLLKEEYGYNKEQIRLTGIPRFDGLKDCAENTILISPTWRTNVASTISNNKIRIHNSNFKNTTYYQVYNSLITNKKLYSLIKKYNYKLLFLIHPTLIQNIDDYDKNEFVDIVSSFDINYEEVLRKSKVMITDYSGIQYDFAYMRKPILYYHNDMLPPSYGNGMMDYDKIGFGEVIHEEDKLIEAIEKLLKENCNNNSKYLKRIDNFFEYNDYNNSKRICDEVMNDGE